MKVSPYKFIKNNRGKSFAVCVFVLILALIFIWQAKRQADSALAREREKHEKAGLIFYEKKLRLPLKTNSIKHLSSTKAIRAVTRFGGMIYAASEGGLVLLSPSGEVKKTYTTIDGLTENDLTSIAIFNSKIFIGTGKGNLLSFNGENFENYVLRDRDLQTITVLFEDRNRLLIGTFAGLIEFDGQNFREIKVGSELTRIESVTRIIRENEKLFVGTFADGIWIEEAGRWSHFTKANGLPSYRIVGVVTNKDDLFVATDFGLASAKFATLKPDSPQTNLFHTVATMPALSDLTQFETRLLLCADDGKVFEINTNQTQTSPKEIEWNKPQTLSECKFAKFNDELLMLSNQGIRRSEEQNRKLLFTDLIQTQETKSLTNNSISAMSFDNEGRLWAGSFRNGLDVFDVKGQKITHIETESAREINAIVADKSNDSMLVATSQGVLSFDASFRSTQLTKANGLLSNSVQHLALSNSNKPNANIALATSRGFSFGTNDKFRSLTTVQNLPNNNTYAVLTLGNTTYLGTLGGLAQIENGKVVRTFKDSNSKLTHNWITALCNIGQRIFIGTYGGGVFEMDASGNLRGFVSETGKIIVNPNAIWSDEQRLYVGTLNGVWIFNLQSQKWRHIQDELPSQTVLSVTGDAHHVYFGTASGIARIEKRYFEE